MLNKIDTIAHLYSLQVTPKRGLKPFEELLFYIEAERTRYWGLADLAAGLDQDSCPFSLSHIGDVAVTLAILARDAARISPSRSALDELITLIEEHRRECSLEGGENMLTYLASIGESIKRRRGF